MEPYAPNQSAGTPYSLPVNGMGVPAAPGPNGMSMPGTGGMFVPGAGMPMSPGPGIPGGVNPTHVPGQYPPPRPVPPMAPIAPAAPTLPASPVNPTAVVRVLSPVGVEYVFMTICLFAAAGGLAAALIALVNGKTDFAVLAFPTALLLVDVPVFALLFLHAKRQELRYPVLRQDPSKRRSTQFTQITCFLVSLLTLIGVVSAVFAKLGGQSDMSLGKTIMDGLVLLVVFGGILAYYWHDEHRLGR